MFILEVVMIFQFIERYQIGKAQLDSGSLKKLTSSFTFSLLYFLTSCCYKACLIKAYQTSAFPLDPTKAAIIKRNEKTIRMILQVVTKLEVEMFQLQKQRPTHNPKNTMMTKLHANKPQHISKLVKAQQLQDLPSKAGRKAPIFLYYSRVTWYSGGACDFRQIQTQLYQEMQLTNIIL